MDTSGDELIIKPAFSNALNNLCPNNCSGNGDCSTGNCNCNTNFTGVDCSIDERATPSIIDTTLTGIWDLSRGPLTDIIVRTRQFVSTNPEAKFKYLINVNFWFYWLSFMIKDI